MSTISVVKMSIEEAGPEKTTTEQGDEVQAQQDKQDSPEPSTNGEQSGDNQLADSLKTMTLEEKPISNGVSRPSREDRYAAQVESDSRSIFVGNITSEITPEILDEHFKNCGTIKRITLLYDRNTGAPKGYAYVEFDDTDAQIKALEYNGSELKGANITVYKKRTNLPGYRRRFNYQKPDFYYQQQWGYPYENYQANGNINMYPPFNFASEGTQGFSHYRGGFRGRGNYRGRRQGQYKNQYNSSKRTGSEATSTALTENNEGENTSIPADVHDNNNSASSASAEHKD